MELCVDFYFSRLFTYPAINDGKGVEFCVEKSIFWQNHQNEFELVRDHLNNVKGRLGIYCEGSSMRSDWHSHTESMHLFSGLSRTLVRCMGSELTTRAWLKFYDILARFPRLTQVTDENGRFISAHLCEAPGAFISALNHRFDSLSYGQSPNALDRHWFANTLNPYHELSKQNEAIFDDQLIACRPDNWLFGFDDTGDILLPENIADLWRKLGRQSCDCVTADGAIDCQSNPAEQELTLSQLDYAEVTTAAGLLRPGGNFVIKLFTLFELPTACLVFLLTKMFEQVNVYKPAASKPGNSEVYFACLGYIFNPDLVEKLFFGLKEKQPLNVLLTESFLSVHFECAKYFSLLQCEAIERNISAFEYLRPQEQNRLYDQLSAARWEAERYFIEKACAPLYPLSQDKKLIAPHLVAYLSLCGNKQNQLSSKEVDEIEGKIKCESTFDPNCLILVTGKLPREWTQIENTLFCSPGKLALFKSSFNSHFIENFGNYRSLLIAKSPPASTLKQVLAALSQLKCSLGECVVFSGLPPPISRSLAGIARILLTKFQSIVLGNGAWLCEFWLSQEPTFDPEIVDHLKKASECDHPGGDTMGVVEVVKLSTLVCDRTFRASIFQANNNLIF